MELRLLHFYPDLMSLYGSYASLAVLRRRLEQMGNTVTVEAVLPGAQADLTGADFLFMGAGTERSQKAALADFVRYADAVKAAAEAGVAQLYTGNAMELLGKTITDAHGKTYDGIAMADFTSVQGKRRIVGDVYGLTDLYGDAVVGFMNKSGVCEGITEPLITAMHMGHGNSAELSAEGFYRGSVFASQLTGPILVKNPRLLDAVVAAIYAHRGEALPEVMPRDEHAEAGFAVTARELKARWEKG